MNQVIRHRLAWDRNPKGGLQVFYDEPMSVSGKELACIQQVDENKEEMKKEILRNKLNELLDCSTEEADMILAKLGESIAHLG